MDDSIEYQYEPMVLGENKIRVLRLQKRCQDESARHGDSPMLHCSLEYRALLNASEESDVGDYEALSYSWDVAMGQGYVRLSGKLRKVSANLVHALAQLQNDDTDRILWADQLCINQDSAIELADQISQMRTIYARASRVIVWLGWGNQLSDLAMNALECLSGVRKSRTSEKLRIVQMPSWSPNFRYGDGQALVSSQVYEDLSQKLASLASRSYWSRLWVQQEFVVGRKVAIVCGTKSLSIEDFEQGWHEAYNISIKSYPQPTHRVSNQSAADSVASHTNSKLTLTSWDAWLAVNRLISNRREYETSRQRFGFKVAGQGLDTSNAEHNPLFLIMYKNLTSFSGQFRLDCMDPRDRCFALLGLASDQAFFERFPDYTRDATEIFEELARKFLAQRHTDVLSFCQEGPNISSKRLASWAPDWTQNIRIPLWGKIRVSTASDWDCSDALDFPDDKTIRLKGVCIGVVHLHGQNFATQDPLTLAETRSFLLDLRKFCDLSERVPNEYADHVCAQIAATTARSFLAEPDRMFQEYNLLQSRLNAPTTLIEHTEDVTDPDQEFASLYEEAVRLQLFRCPFLTEEGYVGIAQPFVREGDLICAFPGGALPYVIRPQLKSDRFALVSAAYVNGMMNGECLKANLKQSYFTLV